MSIYVSRLNNLRKIIDNNCLLITNENNIYYFTGFQHSEGALLVFKDESYLLVDFRYYESACNIVKDSKVVEFTKYNQDIIKLVKKHNIKSVTIESKSTTLDVYNRMIKSYNEQGISLKSNGSLDNVIENLRLIKSDDEIAFIKKAQSITEKAYTQVLNYIKPKVSERKIAIELEYLMKQYGAKDVSFDLITITGKKTSLPHGVPSDDIIEAGDLFTMDIGAIYNGYHSDMTRTVAVKSCDDEKAKVYNIVLDAQLKALNSVKAGVKASYVDKVARDLIYNAGYKGCFGHSTGHGVGLDIHESPAVSPRSETILSPNMVITIEPGIYINNRFGVRIEDMVLVTEKGYKNFATLSKELIII